MTSSDLVFGGKEDNTMLEPNPQKVTSSMPPLSVSGSGSIMWPDYRCFSEGGIIHDHSLASFQQECVQSGSSTAVGPNDYKILDHVTDGSPPDIPDLTSNLPYFAKQRKSLQMLMTSVYAMSKYMMLASGSRQVSLLQGMKFNVSAVFMFLIR